MKTNTYGRAIRQLVELGFINKKQTGGLFKRTNIYSFSDKWRSYKRPVHMAEYRRATENGSVRDGKKRSTTTEMGSVGNEK
jgi:hypothetical protein